MWVITSPISSFVTPLARARSICPLSWSPRYMAARAATVMRLRSRLDRPGRSHTSPERTFSLRSMSLGTTPRTSSRAAETGAGVAMTCLLSNRPAPSGEGEGRVRVTVCSGDLDDAGLHLLEAIGHLGIVAGRPQLPRARGGVG